ncbi:hypothetical protein HYZ99_03355 [Candidatus Peregrinibacteria bacterium]|nr:hypothetical protein [Candidatus Peregrinibacteria bacterium]
MRTHIIRWIATLLMMFQTVPAFAEESTPTIPIHPKTADELMDEECRAELKIPEGRIWQPYLLSKYRACLNQKRQDVKAKKDAAILLQKSTASAEQAKPRLERIRRGSRRMLRNQSIYRQSLQRNQNLKAGKKTFLRFRRRQILQPAAGSGS